MFVAGSSSASPTTSTAGAPFFSDSFDGPSLDPSRWYIPTHDPAGDGTLVGRTQFRVTQDSSLPAVTGGKVCIPVQTYSPRLDTFYGTEIVTRQEFALGTGLDIIVRARMTTSDHRGIVGGMFLYSLKSGSDTLHDEIDFELLTNAPDRVQTNIYADEPLGDGHPQSIPYRSGTIADWHTYEIKWIPGRVSWIVDGETVRTATSNVPTRPMNFYLNDWVPDHWWPQAYSESIQPTKSKESNTVLESLCVDRVIVRPLPP